MTRTEGPEIQTEKTPISDWQSINIFDGQLVVPMLNELLHSFLLTCKLKAAAVADIECLLLCLTRSCSYCNIQNLLTVPVNWQLLILNACCCVKLSCKLVAAALFNICLPVNWRC
jgi:hypothetical protein